MHDQIPPLSDGALKFLGDLLDVNDDLDPRQMAYRTEIYTWLDQQAPLSTDPVVMGDGSAFSRACALGQDGYHCDGFLTDEETCECPCHDYWDGETDLARFHADLVHPRFRPTNA